MAWCPHPPALLPATVCAVAALAALLLALRRLYREDAAFARLPGERSSALRPLGSLLEWKDLLKANRKILSAFEAQPSPGRLPVVQHVCWKATVAVVDKADVDAVLRASTTRSLVPPLLNALGLYHITRFMGPASVGVSEGAQWVRQRKAIGKSLSNSLVRGLYSHIEASVALIASTVPSAREVDVAPLLRAMALDVVCAAVFKEDFGALRGLLATGRQPPIVEAFDFAGEEMARRISSLHPLDWLYFVQTPRNRELAHAHRVLRSTIRGIVARNRARGAAAAAGDAAGLVAHLVADPTVGDDELIDASTTMLWAGHDTTATAIGAALWLLAEHPAVQDTLRESLAHQPLCNDAIAGNAHLQAVVYEVLRLHPPALWTNRGLLEHDLELPSGFRIPKGSQAFVPVWAVHRAESNWPKADQFLPFERFLDNTERRIHTNGLVPFGGGLRLCPGGNSLAPYEIKTALAHLVARFRFHRKRHHSPAIKAVGMFMAVSDNELLLEPLPASHQTPAANQSQAGAR